METYKYSPSRRFLEKNKEQAFFESKKRFFELGAFLMKHGKVINREFTIMETVNKRPCAYYKNSSFRFIFPTQDTGFNKDDMLSESYVDLANLADQTIQLRSSWNYNAQKVEGLIVVEYNDWLEGSQSGSSPKSRDRPLLTAYDDLAGNSVLLPAVERGVKGILRRPSPK